MGEEELTTLSTKGQAVSTSHAKGQSEVHFVREKLEKFQAKMLHDFQLRMTTMIEDVLQDMRQSELRAQEFSHFTLPNGGSSTSKNDSYNSNSSTWINRQQTVPKLIPKAYVNDSSSPNGVTATTAAAEAQKNLNARQLPVKVFKIRESYLTALLQVDHMKAVYHIFYIIFTLLLLQVLCYDYAKEGRFYLGLRTFKSGLERIHWVFGAWLLEHVFVLALYYAFQGWALVRYKLKPQSSLQRFWSHSCLIMYISAQLVFLYVSSSLSWKFRLPFVSSSVLVLESTRLLMKMHAFVRYNAARVIAGKLKSNEDDDEHAAHGRPFVPPMHCYVYFLFAPTLLYRDTYPRTSQIRWKFALKRLLEIVAIAFMYSFLHERHIQVHVAQFGLEQVNASDFIMKVFSITFASTMIFLSGFYLILHSWLNLSGELMRFGDRMFYKDWWTSYTYDSYYRNWNVVVHDFLHEYVYRDVYMHIFKGSKVAASLVVFIISALAHEQVLIVGLKMFFPVMFIFFGVMGVGLIFVTRRAPKTLGNLVLWFTLIVGNCIMYSLYTMEYYAQENCKLRNENWTDSIVPAMWRCFH